MLKELYIENLAVIEKATIPIENGFNVFTGETGAGKSILINGINAVLGQRTSKDIVRTGCKKAVVSARFSCDSSVRSALEEYGIDIGDDEILISREISSDGGSVARINSRPVNLSVVREVGELLVNIHGQHDNQILLSPEKHIDILDSFGELGGQIEDYQSSFRELQDISRKIKRLSGDEAEKKQRIAELNNIIAEIQAYNIYENEDAEVEEEFQLMKNSETLRSVIYEATAILTGTDEEKGADSAILDAYRSLSLNSELYGGLEELAQRVQSVSIEINDISQELFSIVDTISSDPKRFEYLSERREDLRKIMKKYGPELSDVLKKYEDHKAELAALENSDSNMLELAEKRKALLSEVTAKAKKLSENRKKAADRFIAQVTAELEFLNMPNVSLAVSQHSGKLTLSGMDSIEFLISANVGEEPRPIAKIASGGELSRIMLALKNVIAEKDNIPTLIFDEIDTGVSGKAAQKIGCKLKEISRYRQVLCVTHLAQIAIMGNNHLLIEKNQLNGRTVTSVKTLEQSERKYEIARIIGGDNITELTLKNAEEMLDSVK